ncbi:DEAD/DEAH box helicase family protein [Endozoicomonas sp. 4G]|uniref:DEAD/DEAH box helicase n=1 Tax=Endozoicomonas sp. 4G TaxID=2872754 RepID=UPI002078C97A|nr:DEAD/DEAH box helicase family protein [Endozoicomonas sp. 4G]
MKTDAVKTVNQIAARLSLREPQRESLKILANVLDQMKLAKDPDLDRWLQVVQSQYPSVKKFERAFPSLCFALATGVGKTRLMGAMIAWLYLTGKSRHFFVLAPNLTIYEKLKTDFTLGSAKYVFAGIPELAQTPPVVITGEDYEDGRGVRLDYAVPQTLTADLLAYETAPHINVFNISKINAKENKKGAAKSKEAKVRRLQECIGESYFDYLASLPDLVVFMDEAHRYYASAGAKAINDLRPVLGIELTATPKTTGARPRDFSNIVYHYPLARALDDGYVKIPAVATRRDFRISDYSLEQLEKIKLEDGVHHHEYVKAELEIYARSTENRPIKPFMLIVAQDTQHAALLKATVESLFDGRYQNKVIEIHSNQSGEESDVAMQRLLAVERDKDTEIVIHVNKLKEGWDVTNLYTIVPLRASASEILTEQTIGRGLRLPYNKRTGVESVDRLTIIAHDRYQDVIDRANDDESIIRRTVYIGDDDESDVPERKPKVLHTPSWAEMITTGRQATQNDREIKEPAGQYAVPQKNSEQVRVADIALETIQKEAARLSSSRQLDTPEVREKVLEQVQRVVKQNAPLQATLEGLETSNELDEKEVTGIVNEVASKVIEFTIDIPQITVLPTREVDYGFSHFHLTGLDKINFQPVSREILLQHLEDNKTSVIQWVDEAAREEHLENYIVRSLMSMDAIDYDEHSELLYQLAQEMVDHLRGYLCGDHADPHSEKKIENVLIFWQKPICDFIWAQMQENTWKTPTDYIGNVTQGFEILRPLTFSIAADEQPRDFRAPVANKQKVKQMVFTGFSRCCYPFQKFDSVEGELRLAQILESDKDVIRWMKPATGQFRIEYINGRNYEPDFVVEISDAYLMIEPKQTKLLELDEVKLKANAAVRWCGFANEHAKEHGTKPWFYLLIPHDAIELNRSVATLKTEFEYKP